MYGSYVRNVLGVDELIHDCVRSRIVGLKDDNIRVGVYTNLLDQIYIIPLLPIILVHVKETQENSTFQYLGNTLFKVSLVPICVSS